MDDLTRDSPSDAAALSGAGGVLAGRYRVLSRLGRGATKEVYLAHDERLDREVALAIVVGAAGSDAARERVVREAQMTGRLGDHPNVITVYDSGELDGVPYLVMRAMRGGSLADLLERERPSVAEAVRLGSEIAAALAHAHAHGVVHRDVKPDNVWLAADGSAALGDFGIAHREGSKRLTADDVVVGTLRYMAPEQIRGGDVGPASDLYGLGVTLYELLTGRTPHATVEVTSEPAAQGALPPQLEQLVLDLLAIEPQRRPSSAAAVAATLARIAASVEPGRPAASADAAGHAPDARRVVSVLAAVGGAESDDPELLHGLLEQAVTIVERHGASAERHLGDVVLGFFGLHRSHGDDALRAARAAVELRAAAPSLRLGIDSGELFLSTTPSGARIPTGATIKAAERLAEGALGGEILVGPRLRRLLAADAQIDAGRGNLVALRAQQPPLLRAAATPFVGRGRELAELDASFARVHEQRECRIVTVVGQPGIGKSRLAGEFVGKLGDEALVLTGRCLAYGEGTTYRALADLVRGLGGDPRVRVEELLAGDEQSIRGILAAAGLSVDPVQVDETSWALRRLLERLARERTLVVAIEDIHWAEPALLDLLDHVVALSSGAAILIVCLARPELLDRRPAWVAPQPNRSVLVLDALGDADARDLAARLGAADLAGAIAARADGNPLFVEQLVAVDAGHDDRELPESIQAVLAERIDGLEPGERMLLQRAAIEGRTFHADALATLLPEPDRRAARALLVALARKGLIGADRPAFADQDAFRFTHALIRDAAYASVPKVVRAELHATLGAWLAARPAPPEIVGFHAEQACLLLRELGRDGATERVLAERAVAAFEDASRAAMARGDPAAAGGLLERAVAIAGADGTRRGTLLPALGEALFEAGQMTDAMRVLDQVIAAAPAPRLEARARVEREFVRLETDTGAHVRQSLQVADAAQPVLEREGDDHGQCRLWSLRARVAWMVGRLGEADDAWREAAECARRGGMERDLFHVLGWRATAAVLGPTPVDEAIARCEEIAELVAASAVSVAWTHNALAVVHAMKEELDAAEHHLALANATLRELGSLSSSVSHHEAFVRMLSGRPDLAELELAAGVQRLGARSDVDSGLLATTTAMLAQAVCAQGRTREAAELCDATDAAVAPDDNVTQAICAGVRARVLALEGRCEAAQTVAREAIALLDGSDLLWHRGDALLHLAEVLAACGRPDESRQAIRDALELFAAKDNRAAARRARSLLESASGE